MVWIDSWNPDWDDYYGERLDVPTGPSVPLQSPWHLFIRDETYRRRAQVAEIVEFKAMLRMNNVDTWWLTLSAEDPNVDLLSTPKWGIELRYKGISPPVLSGPSFGLRRTWDARTNNVQFNGFSDDLNLSGRVIEQTPAQAITYGQVFQFTTDYDTQTGPAETVIKHYVAANLGSLATPDRQMAGLTIGPNLGRGSSVTEKGRMQRLIEVCQELALAGGDLGFRLTADPENGAVFDVYVPADRSDSVKISPELLNLSKFAYDAQGPTANVVYEGAQEAGANRNFLVLRDAASVALWGRHEVFTDERDTADLPTLLQRATGTLADHGAQTSSTTTPNLEAGGAVFIEDFDIGDTLTVVVDNQPVMEKIRQVELTINAKGVDAQLGQAASGQTPPGPPWQMLQRRLSTRIRNLERRQ